MDIFEFDDYRAFINKCLSEDVRPGPRTKLARAANCSPSWMTRVLGGIVQLTPDQAFDVAQYLRLNEDETDYLLLLVELERASSLLFKKRIQAKLKAIERANRNFGSTVKTDAAIAEADINQYYTSWIYSGAHVACMIRPYAVEELGEVLNIPTSLVPKFLEDLKRMGLVIDKSGKWQATSKNIHLASNHLMSSVSHTLWRSHTIEHLQKKKDGDLNYSAIHCLSKKDTERIRKKLKEVVLDCRNIIERSAPETLAVLCLDWYEL